MVEVFGTFGRRIGVEEVAVDRPELVFGAGGGLAQQRLELGEQVLDRSQVKVVGRQIEDRGAGGGDRLADAVDLVGRAAATPRASASSATALPISRHGKRQRKS
jgi:hypothetical protein